MKEYALFLISFLMLSIDAHAIIPVGAYYGFKGGLTMQDKDINKTTGDTTKNKDKNYFLSADVGVRLLKFRLELEYTFRPDTTKVASLIKKDDVVAHNIMGNVYYNFLELPFFKFYVNGGIGNTKFTGSSNIDKSNSFTWSAGLGTNFSLFNVVNLDVGYRYVDMGEVKFKSGKNIDKHAHDIYAGVRFGF